MSIESFKSSHLEMGATTTETQPAHLDIENPQVGDDIKNVQNTEKPIDGLAQHVEAPRDPEDTRAERRLLRKVDLMVLPILALTLFLGSLVCRAPRLY